MAAPFDLKDDGVVVVIGTGAGGGVLANELAQKGVSVVALEAGGRYLPEDYVNDEWESFGQLAWTEPRTTSGDWRVAKDFSGLPAWIVKAVGGTSIHWAGASLRFQDHEWKPRTSYGNVPGANLVDWPIDGAEMAPWYEKAEAKLGVTRTGDRPGLPGNNNYKVFEAGAKALGYKEVSTGRMAINSIDYDDRMICQQTGFCFQGCKWGAKWSSAYTDIPRGEATGNLEVRDRCHVLRIEHGDDGRVTGVVYADRDGKEQFQAAKIVCVAGNSIESPRLLLNSASNQFPDGLGNSSGQVGRNYMRHMTGSVYAVFPEPVRMWRGTTMAGIVQDEARHDPTRGFVGGFEFETLSLGVPFMAAFLDPGAWGREFTSALDSYPNMAGLWIVGEDMPQETNRVTLNTDVKDDFGLPVANVNFSDHPNDTAMRAYAYERGEALYRAVGATRTLPT
ncbi:GMC family oxidoreductase, partial [Amaricoccus sp.]|uniref:GMC family oxidoreductase n=1 Tax=Amaricoccus sp. TaxID=1872485 RepID=UPI001B3DB85E